ncbi:hypothetical protein BDF19DRAFT_434384 [Syncephalis fuscata]|nr:hypothetical protein BDF19DRAFT_434384 [Syncephalis fuscata]
MHTSRLESILATLPALECTNRLIQTIIQQSNEYWRILYGRTFNWRYVENEENFLVAYRTEIWCKTGRPLNSTPEVWHGEMGHAAFLGINWKEAYKYRLAISKHWNAGLYRSFFYHLSEPESSVFSISYPRCIPHEPVYFRWESSISDLSAQRRYLEPIRNQLNLFLGEPIEISALSDNSANICANYINCYYSMIEFKNRRFIYSQDKLMPLDLPFSTESYMLVFHSAIGRWAIYCTRENPSSYFLVNLATAQRYSIPKNCTANIMLDTANDKELTILTFTSMTGSQYRWKYIKFTPNSSKLEIETLDRGSLQLEDAKELLTVSLLGSGYIKAFCKSIISTNFSIDIFAFNVTSKQPFKKIGSYNHSQTAYRIKRNAALIMHATYCNVISLKTGDVQYSFKFDGVTDPLESDFSGNIFATPMLSTIFCIRNSSYSSFYINGCSDQQLRMPNVDLDFSEFVSKRSSTQSVLTAFVSDRETLEFGLDSE